MVDSSNGNGGIFVSNDRTKAFVVLQEDNAALPLYDSAAGCYRFVNYTLEAKVMSSTADTVKYGLHLDLPTAQAYALLKDAANADMITIGLTINKADGTSQKLSYSFMESTIAAYADQSSVDLSVKKAITLTVSGMSKINATLDAQVNVASVTGVASHVNVQ